MAKAPRPYKLVIRESIMDALYTKMEGLAHKEMYELIGRNAAKRGYYHYSFAFNGVFYNVDSSDGPPVRQRLDISLIPDMVAYLEEFGHPLELEKAKVSGYLSSMLAYSPLPGDYLLLLPSALHAVVQSAVRCDWSTDLSPEKIATFMDKYRPGYELIRLRMATNLIL